METKDTEKRDTGARPLSEWECYAGTPGAAYADEYLGGDGSVNQWIADQVNAGTLAACPRCHFLHLPARPFPLGLPGDAPEPEGACDVCPHVPGALTFPFHCDDMARALAAAEESLRDARLARAELFHELWMGGSRAADEMAWAAMASGLRGLVAPGEGRESK